MDRLAELNEEAARYGLRVRAVFTPQEPDGVPALDSGQPARALALVGNVGSSLWPVFAASPEHGDGERDALDRWSRRVGTQMAQRLGARALFPFGGPPHHPFQRWAMRGGDLFASPVGLLVHSEYGLWHAFRFALAFGDPLGDSLRDPFADSLGDSLGDSPARSDARSPCDICDARPCLHACPVGAFVEGEYRVAQCVEHLVAHPQGPCVTAGCLARHACPVGQAYRVYAGAGAAAHARVRRETGPSGQRIEGASGERQRQDDRPGERGRLLRGDRVERSLPREPDPPSDRAIGGRAKGTGRCSTCC